MRVFLKNGNGLEPIETWQKHCWINIECPNDDDRDYVINELKVPLSFYNDIEDIDERPRIEVEDGWYFILLRIPYKTNDDDLPFTTIPLGVIFNEDIILSVCFFETELIQDFIEHTKRKNITVENNFDLLLKLLLSSSIWFLKYLKQINQQIKNAESKLDKSIKNEDLQRLLQIEKCLVYFLTSLKGNDILLHRIKNIKSKRDAYDLDLIEDVEVELKQAQEITNIYSDILSGMMDAYASVISNNLNVVMKRLTSISIILMIPTLIASLYGMNVPNTFENSPFGFWFILLFSFLLSTSGVMFFKSRNWL
ncbi:magnesium transporter CorA family protein [Chlorobium sp. BLA1]|uniref:magnesium transporter CorA family protein n=1 Tax=Candidatus Chlorobium masyuteum TaxID=2716876 RepID=UPI001422C1B2|nr:magnesium transporter CorA family protein [Candidatus Chlorobium masyuteum]NHQ60314.1 magnesium transporter CorA family protein [Candidatus Chlorobium masyuteum]NTU44114.1 magnesium transporter CorA family protein [Chlorobiaceae bacterium]